MNDYHLCGFQDHEGHRCPNINVELTLIPWLDGAAWLCPMHQLLFVPLPTPWRVYLDTGNGQYIENVGMRVH